MPTPTQTTAAIASQDLAQNGEVLRSRSAPARKRGAEAAPVEIVRVLEPYVAQPDRRDAASSEEHTARSRAGMLAAWLREGGEREDLPPLPGGGLPTGAPAPARIESRSFPLADEALSQAASQAALSEEAQVAVEASESEKLALRIQLLGGEICEQVFGPSRRWALLDRNGALLEEPQTEWVSELVETGALTLDRFERGSAVWRLAPASTERRAAYIEKAAARGSVEPSAEPVKRSARRRRTDKARAA